MQILRIARAGLWTVFTLIVAIKAWEISAGTAEHGAIGETGYFVWVLLVAIIYLSLLTKLARLPWLGRLLPLRWDLGLMMAGVATWHALVVLLPVGLEYWPEVLLLSGWGVTAGSVAFVLSVPLTLTSSRWAQQRLGARHWRWLHKLTHAIFLLSVVHILLITYSYGELNLVVAAELAGYLVGYGWLWWRQLAA